MKHKSISTLHYYIIFILAITLFYSCASQRTNNLTAFHNMINCQYEYNDLKNIQLGNIKVNNGVSVSNMPKVIAYLGEKKTNKILKFDINILIENTSSSIAKFSEMEYIVIVDNIELGSGVVKENTVISPKPENAIKFNIPVKTDLEILKAKNPNRNIDEITKAILGFQKNKANMTVFLTPTIVNNGKKYKSPMPVEINFPIGK